MKRLVWLIALCTLLCSSTLWAGSAVDGQADGVASTIPPGTVVTMENWEQYRNFMTDGMIALFSGKYFWKMPPDIRIEVAPTDLHPLPKNYLAATEKYSGQVKIVELPGGGLTLQDYVAGIPFPNPQEPHKGWKVLLNLWFRYSPYLVVDTDAPGCAINSAGSISCERGDLVTRQLSYNTDEAIPTAPAAKGAKFSAEWFMIVEPEDQKYTTSLLISYADPSQEEDVYAFLPALRRYQRLSASARCAPNSGMDFTDEDFHSGFDSNLTESQADYVTRKKILALVDANPPTKPFPEGFYMPLAWPQPSWAKFQLRDVDVLSIKRIPSKAAGYCYGKRVLYADAHFSGPLWQEIYDAKMKLWKFYEVAPQRIEVPGIGPQNAAGGDMEVIYDVQNNHATWAAENASTLTANGNAPKEFLDVERYTTPGGLNLIMR